MSRIILAAALSALAMAAPYPPDVAVPGPVPTLQPFYGHIQGNFQPTKTKPAPGSPVVLAKGGVVSGGAAVGSINNQDGIGAGSDRYVTYSGDGSQGAGWPTKGQWVSFANMFDNNKAVMFSSCANQGWGVNDSGPEVGAIYDAIQDAATKTKVDHRFILAVIIQESGGCVRAPTSNFGVRNPGLMQTHNGDGTCNSDRTGQVQSPCPTGVIFEMVSDGTAGTNDGDGLAQTINQATNQFGVTLSRAFYIAARLYNSGSVAASNNLQDGIATHCYSSDIANRLTGWVQAQHTCPFDG